MTATNGTFSPDGSSQAVSPGDGDSAEHSNSASSFATSFGAALRKYTVPAGGGGRGGQHDRTQAGQQKKDPADLDSLTTVPVQTSEKTRDVLPLNLSILLPNSPPAAGDRDLVNDPSGINRDGSNRGSLISLSLPAGSAQLPTRFEARVSDASAAGQSQIEQPALSPAGLSPTALAAAAPSPTRLSSAGLPSTTSSRTELPSTGLSPTASSPAPSSSTAPSSTASSSTAPSPTAPSPTAHSPVAQASNPQASAQSPESLAFAVRLSPSTAASPEGDEAAKTAEGSSVRSQTTSQVNQKELPLSDAAGVVGKPTDPAPEQPADRSAMVNAVPNGMPLPTQVNGQSEPASGAAKSDAHAIPTFSLMRAEPVNSPPAASSGSSRDFTVRIPDATDRGTNIRFVERGSEVHVSVRTADSELAQVLRGGLNDLAGRLQHSGVQAEVWRPGSDSPHGNSQDASQDGSADPRGFGGRRNQSGTGRDGQDQPNQDKPRWVEELESFGQPAGANTF